MKNNNYITSIGYSGLRETLAKLRSDYKALMEEMQEVKNNCLSTDDSSELNHYRMMLDALTDKIEETENLIETAVVVDIDSITNTIASFGNLVTIENLDTGKVSTYRLVSAFESDPKEGRISIHSPLGSAIRASKVGDVIDVESPSGCTEYEIIEISK